MKADKSNEKITDFRRQNMMLFSYHQTNLYHWHTAFSFTYDFINLSNVVLGAIHNERVSSEL